MGPIEPGRYPVDERGRDVSISTASDEFPADGDVFIEDVDIDLGRVATDASEGSMVVFVGADADVVDPVVEEDENAPMVECDAEVVRM